MSTTSNLINAPEPFNPSKGGTGVANGSSSTITIGGAFVISGAHTTTFTVTGDTSVTFPTSGTLATTSQIPTLPVSLANGGTGAAITASNGGIFYSNASTGALLSGTATANQALLSGSSTTPAWSTATYPATTTANQILYSSSTNTIAGLATGNSGALITSAGGVPSISSTLPSAVQGNITTVGALASGSLASGFTVVTAPLGGTGVANTGTITLGGNLVTSGAHNLTFTISADTSVTLPTSGTLVNTAVTTLSSLVSVGALSTGSLAAGFTPVTVPIGGTGAATFTAYSVICAGTTSTGAMQNVSGLGSSGEVLTSNGAGALPTWQAGGGGGSGTVTSVGLTQTGSFFTITGSPVTTSGNLNLAISGTLALANGGTNAALTASNGGIFYSTGSAGAILSGTATAGQLLTSGASTTPAWTTSTYPATNAISTLLYASSANVMAALATANNGVLITGGTGIPSISSTIPAATQANITATGAVASGSLAAGFTPVTVPIGGTGAATFTAYSVICAGTTSTGTMQNVSGVGTSGQVLTSNGAAALPTWQAAGGGSGSSTTTSVAQVSHGLAVGNFVKCTGNDTYAKAQADTAADAEVIGVVSVVADADHFTLLTAGVITTLSGLTAGTVYFLDPSSAGGYTATAPSTAGQIRKPVMVAIDTTSALVTGYIGEVIPGAATSSSQGANMIMNGDFQVFARTAMGFGGDATLAVAASTTTYCLDRFQILTNATQATTITQKKVSQWVFGARIQRNSGQTGTGVMKFGTSLTSDMAAGIQGNAVTLQFIASTGADWSPSSGNLTVTVQYSTGTGSISNISSTFTGATSVISQTIALGTSAAATLYTYTSSTIPTTATQLSVVFSWTPVGTASTNDWVQIQALQCEIGTTANLFQRVPLATQIQNCQMFYQKNIDSLVAPAQGAGNVSGAFFQSTCAASNTCNTGVRFTRTTWKAGVITLYNPVSANAQVRNYGTSADCGSTTANTSQGNDGFKLVFATDSGATTNSYYAVIYGADSDVT